MPRYTTEKGFEMQEVSMVRHHKGEASVQLSQPNDRQDSLRSSTLSDANIHTPVDTDSVARGGVGATTSKTQSMPNMWTKNGQQLAVMRNVSYCRLSVISQVIADYSQHEIPDSCWLD